MADPTLKDVLAALAALDKQVTRELATVRAEMATKDALADVHEAVSAVASDVNAHRAETAKAFDALDAELTGHASLSVTPY